MTTMTLSCNSTDCYGSPGLGFLTGTTSAYVGGSTSSSDTPRVWIPFTVGLPRMTITSATLRVVGASSGNVDAGNIRIHASAEDNASDPASWAALEAKTPTSANEYPATLPSSDGVEYSYTVTSIVQEILDRGGWTLGNNLAIMISTITYDSTKRCTVALTEHATYAEPKLDIVFTRFVPKSGGLV